MITSLLRLLPFRKRFWVIGLPDKLPIVVARRTSAYWIKDAEVFDGPFSSHMAAIDCQRYWAAVANGDDKTVTQVRENARRMGFALSPLSQSEQIRRLDARFGV